MKILRSLLAAAVIAAFVLTVSGPALAEDPLTAGPDIYKLVFENERVRVMEITFQPGASIAMHSHPDHFVYVLTPGTLELGHEDGKTVKFEGEPGKVTWIPAESHTAVNTGPTVFKALVVELKETAAKK